MHQQNARTFGACMQTHTHTPRSVRNLKYAALPTISSAWSSSRL
jgi:hypothetical protein